MMEEMYLIWSFEHNAWWGPNERGYTTTISEAGRYTAGGAISILCTCEPGYEMPVSEEHAAGPGWHTGGNDHLKGG